MTPRAARFTVVGLVLLTLASAYHLKLFAQLSEPATLAHTLVELGAWGYLAFVVSYTVLQPFGVPGTIFVAAAPLIWPWPTAFALSMAGTMGASVVGFAFARFVARDWVAQRIPARFKEYDAALERNALQTVIVLRLIFWMPQVLHSFFGVSKVPFWTHFWGSLLGYAPPLFAVSYLGSRIFDASGHLQPGAWPIFGAFIAVSLAIAALTRLHRRRSAAQQRSTP
ncbi:MAG: VTT domain-containing protein [Myxococcaceae bacterium]